MSQKGSINRKFGVLNKLCDYFGITRQGYYKHVDRHLEIKVLETSIILYCLWLRGEMPKAGMRELYYCCLEHFKEKMIIGRDRCYELFRSNGLVIRKKRTRPKTTNSNHNHYIYPDLLNTTPKFVASKSGMMVVGDITYVATLNGWIYLSLLTDTASRVIVGYALHSTLETEGPMKALQNAICFYEENHIDISGLIHHSGRGVQYCSNLYVNELKAHRFKISMTQCGDPLHNAMAERINNTIKNGWLFDTEELSFDQVLELVDKAVHTYNNLRPHQALGMKTPMEV